MDTVNTVPLIVYSVNDVDAAKKVFSVFLGTEPYVDGAYYVGYRVGGLEIGLDPYGQSQGFTTPIAYVDTSDIEASVQALVDSGAEVVQDVMEVPGGLKIARLKDGNGNVLGLRQSS